MTAVAMHEEKENNMRTLLTRLVLRAAEYCDRNLITVPDIDEWGAAPVWVSPTIDPSLFIADPGGLLTQRGSQAPWMAIPAVAGLPCSP
jgi:hypothetical protein